MKTEIVITIETDSSYDFYGILTQLGLLLIDNTDKIKDFEIQHKELKEEDKSNDSKEKN